MGQSRRLIHPIILTAMALTAWQCSALRPSQAPPTESPSATNAPPSCRQLTTSSADQLAPSFSSDGSRLIYQSNSDGNWELYTLALADGRAQRLTDTADLEEDPSWSPDGRWILCTTQVPSLDANTPRDILLMDAAGRNRQLIAAHGADDFYPRFSLDGRAVYFISDRLDDRKDVEDSQRLTAVFRYSLDTGSLETLSEAGSLTSPVPVTDGLALRAGDHQIQLLKADASWATAVLDSTLIVGQLDYHGSRGWVVSSLDAQRDGRLKWRSPQDSAWQEWPLDEREAEWTPAIAPDGNSVAFAGRVSGQWDLFLRTLPPNATPAKP